MRKYSRNFISAHSLSRGILLLVLWSLATSAGPMQDYAIDWHTIDGGGEIQSVTADETWQLSGTIGQPDSTELLELSGSGWTLTGGFWPVTVDQTDLLFRGGFEGRNRIWGSE